jgi:dephospho-CoA kinase
MLRQLQASASPYTLLASPLLLESSQHKMAKRILLIDVPEELQLSRTASRDQGCRSSGESDYGSANASSRQTPARR